MPAAVRRAGDDLLLKVRLTPKADRDRIDGPSALSDGTAVLAARVTAVAEGGKANAALLVLLAKAIGVPKSRISIDAGATSRLKSVRIATADAEVEATLTALCDG